MLAAEKVGMPWSLTLHRWDIGANNLLERKLGSACFTRVISKSGEAAVRQVVPHAQVEVIHMGVRLAALPDHNLASRPLRLVCVAGLVPVKDHLGLLAAFASVAADHDVSLDLIGGGPLEETIRAEIGRLDLLGQVRLLGSLSHAALLARLRAGEWGGVVLASRADGHEHEGIPVSLMEAMAAGIPVLGTDRGGTGELLGGGAGLLVPVNDFSALESALRGFVSDDAMRLRLAADGYARIAESFDVVPLAARLRTRFAECGG
jgi:glycosyltransferase involved in cell wall biosynthesis